MYVIRGINKLPNRSLDRVNFFVVPVSVICIVLVNERMILRTKVISMLVDIMKIYNN